MKILISDDTELHRKTFITAATEAATRMKIAGFSIIGQAVNGRELIQLYESHRSNGPIDVIFTDIRMPTLDGLSALVILKHLNPNQKIVIVSSEDVAMMETKYQLRSETGNKEKGEAEKLELLEKIAARLRQGTVEPGKIHSILEGCEKLVLDPVQVAKLYKASGYVKKPFSTEKIEKIFKHLIQSSAFFMDT